MVFWHHDWMNKCQGYACTEGVLGPHGVCFLLVYTHKEKAKSWFALPVSVLWVDEVIHCLLLYLTSFAHYICEMIGINVYRYGLFAAL